MRYIIQLMLISFESNNDIIVYALEMILSFASINWYLFLAQSVWWISSIDVLE
jgi:hypothetical protein